MVISLWIDEPTSQVDVRLVTTNAMVMMRISDNQVVSMLVDEVMQAPVSVMAMGWRSEAMQAMSVTTVESMPEMAMTMVESMSKVTLKAVSVTTLESMPEMAMTMVGAMANVAMKAMPLEAVADMNRKPTRLDQRRGRKQR